MKLKYKITEKMLKYDKEDQQGQTAFNKRKPNTTQQHEQAARSP
jgi:hypothetical protein